MKRFLCGIVALTFSIGLIGCGEDKPKAPAGVSGELKPLANPGSPGGEAPKPAGKGKPAAPGGGASTG